MEIPSRRAASARISPPLPPLEQPSVTPMAFANTPLGMGFGKTRFASPDDSFQAAGGKRQSLQSAAQHRRWHRHLRGEQPMRNTQANHAAIVAPAPMLIVFKRGSDGAGEDHPCVGE